jgi:O-antigen ligase
MTTGRLFDLRLHEGGLRSLIPVLAVGSVAVAALATLYLGLPVYFLPLGLAAILMIVLTLRSPTLGMCFVIGFQYLPLAVGGFTFYQLVGGAVAILCLIWFGIHQQSLSFPRIILPLVVFAIIVLQSLSFTHDSDMTLYGVRKLVFNIVFCLLLINVVEDYRRLRAPLWTLTVMGLLNSAVAAYQYAFRSEFEFRARGLLENENQLGEVAAMAFIIPFYYFLREKDRRWQVFYLGICGLLSAGIVASVSRGATLSFLIGLIYILIREKRYRKQFIIVGAIILAAIPFLPQYFMHRFQNIGEEMKGLVFMAPKFGLSSRGYYNKAGLRIWKAHPVLGVGYGNFGYYFIRPEINPGMRASHSLPAHNIYIQALAETGTVGFLVLMWWILQAGLNYRAAERKTGDDESSTMYLRICETITFMVLIANFSGGSIVYTHLAMALALSAVCRKASERLPLTPASLAT